MNKHTKLNHEPDFTSYPYLHTKKIFDQISCEIGKYIFEFNVLEREVTMAIADKINEADSSAGYEETWKMRTKEKIKKFYSLYLESTSGEDKDKLESLKQKLNEMNTFRNKVAHANWQTLDESNQVRTRVSINDKDKDAEFEFTKIDKETLTSNTQNVAELWDEIQHFKERVLKFEG
jgi:hypothetical protein